MATFSCFWSPWLQICSKVPNLCESEHIDTVFPFSPLQVCVVSWPWIKYLQRLRRKWEKSWNRKIEWELSKHRTELENLSHVFPLPPHICMPIHHLLALGILSSLGRAVELTVNTWVISTSVTQITKSILKSKVSHRWFQHNKRKEQGTDKARERAWDTIVRKFSALLKVFELSSLGWQS